MKKLLYTAVAACLALSMCACAGKGVSVSVAKSSGTTDSAVSVQETTKAPVAGDFVETKTERHLPGTFNFLITGEKGQAEGSVPNRIPRLLLTSADAQRINEEIASAYDSLLEQLEEAAATHPMGRIDYVAYLNGNILSLAIESRSVDTPNSTFNVYNLDVTTGKELSYEETAALSDKGLSNAQAEVIAAINELFDDMAQNGAPNKIIEQARSSSISEENLSKVKYYFNGEGKLTAAFRYTGVAGASDYGEIAVIHSSLSSKSGQTCGSSPHCLPVPYVTSGRSFLRFSL